MHKPLLDSVVRTGVSVPDDCGGEARVHMHARARTHTHTSHVPTVKPTDSGAHAQKPRVMEHESEHSLRLNQGGNESSQG